MQKAVLGHRQNVPVEYVFSNRRPEGKFTREFGDAFRAELEHMSQLRLESDEASWFAAACPFLGNDYMAYLANYRYNPDEIDFRIKDNELALKIAGPWERTILWEVPLMSTISELYFRHCDTDWTYCGRDYQGQQLAKAELLRDWIWADFGTRRRRSYIHQNVVVAASKGRPGFVGTSNVHLAHVHGVKPIGTMAHEWIMGISALEGLRYANRHALKIWSKIFHGNLGIALTDTFGSAAFFEDFSLELAKLYDGVRHDSGDPIVFGEQTIAHYQKLGIDPLTKTIVFSDGLNPQEAVRIAKHFAGRIKFSFGIGTNFTNDHAGSKALNMVIKLWMCNNIPVVKLSDTPGKQIGDRDALRVANWTFHGTRLDAA
jgi:nicotinate phosphoribosyltransferase